MYCSYFEKKQCHSCTLLATPYEDQLSLKQQELQSLFQQAHIDVDEWLGPVENSEKAFRYKAKMVVGGSVEQPELGAVNQSGELIDLCDCPLYPVELTSLFPILKSFISRAGLSPYHIEKKRGELKFILLSLSRATHQVMIRFVLRSEKKRHSIECHLPWLLQQIPSNSVISLNIQPVAMAVLEGEQEFILTSDKVIKEKFNHVPLFIQPKSFFQTNPVIAEKLYATAQQWSLDLPVNKIWDLFCGVGGFGLHCVNAQRKLTGIEISQSAIECAKLSANIMQLEAPNFQALDSTLFAQENDEKIDLLIVNPPRRGLGEKLCQRINELDIPYIIYSSCLAQSLVKDVCQLNNYHVHYVQFFDMFPHTSHYEVLTLLIRKG